MAAMKKKNYVRIQQLSLNCTAGTPTKSYYLKLKSNNRLMCGTRCRSEQEENKKVREKASISTINT